MHTAFAIASVAVALFPSTAAAARAGAAGAPPPASNEPAPPSQRDAPMWQRKPVGDKTAPVPDPDAVAKFLEKVLDIAESAPKRASISLARILVPITLVPVKGADGKRRYEARGALDTNPAALSDGRVSVNASCGGKPWSKADLLAFTPILEARRAHVE